jgi:hypothetical protein
MMEEHTLTFDWMSRSLECNRASETARTQESKEQPVNDDFRFEPLRRYS